MGQTDPIYACTGTNHARYLILVEVIVEKKLDR